MFSFTLHLVQCPYDTESVLMIALVSVLILEAAISLSGVIESSQLLCCAVSVRFSLFHNVEWETGSGGRQ